MDFRQIFYCCFTCLLANTTLAQESDGTSKITKPEAAFVEHFNALGYSVLSRTPGNLNGDALEDLVMVFNMAGEDTLSVEGPPQKRVVAILVQHPGGAYTLDAANENLVYYYGYDQNFPEALVDITITDRSFTINHYGGFAIRWGRSTTFRYDERKKNWLFERDEYTTFNATDPETLTSERVVTRKQAGRILCGDFDIYKEFK